MDITLDDIDEALVNLARTIRRTTADYDRDTFMIIVDRLLDQRNDLAHV